MRRSIVRSTRMWPLPPYEGHSQVAGAWGNLVTDQTPNPAGPKKPTGPRASPMRFLWPIALGLAVGSAIYYGYGWWSHRAPAQQAAADAPGDPDLDKPTADECAMARLAASAVHAAG